MKKEAFLLAALTAVGSAAYVSLTNTPGSIFANGFDGPAPTACPANRQTTATVCWNYNLSQSACQNIDATNFDNVFGRNKPGASPIPFPGYNEFAVVKNFDRTKYLALRTDVPASGLSAAQTGLVTHGETFPGPMLDVAISANCGDFNPPSTMCKTTTTGGQIAGKWKVPTATDNGCVLVPGRSYYLNVRATPDKPAGNCPLTGNQCPTTLQSNHTP